MPVNADKPERWAGDIAASVILYNEWFIAYAPEAFHAAREKATKRVHRAMELTRDLRDLSGERLRQEPGVLSVMRMITAPPLAVDRLVGLSGASKSLVNAMEQERVPPRMRRDLLQSQSEAIATILQKLADPDLFSWLSTGREPSQEERIRAISVVADRLAGASANPDIRNAQEERQLERIRKWLSDRGYREQRPETKAALDQMETGTYAVHVNVPGGPGGEVTVSVDVVVQPHEPRPSGLPLLVEAKSAGDFTNVNKRRKEEADKLRHLREQFGDAIEYLLVLGGYFDRGYLSYEARAGIDWVWEHRIGDLAEFGI